MVQRKNCIDWIETKALTVFPFVKALSSNGHRDTSLIRSRVSPQLEPL